MYALHRRRPWIGDQGTAWLVIGALAALFATGEALG